MNEPISSLDQGALRRRALTGVVWWQFIHTQDCYESGVQIIRRCDSDQLNDEVAWLGLWAATGWDESPTSQRVQQHYKTKRPLRDALVETVPCGAAVGCT